MSNAHPDTEVAVVDHVASADSRAAESDLPQPVPAHAAASTAESVDDGLGTGDKPHASTRRRSSNGGRATGSDGAPSDPQSSLQEELLTPLSVPQVTLDRRVLPPNMVDALDAAGLGGRETLPASALITLATVTAVAGPGMRCEADADLRGQLGNSSDTGLRVALIAQDRRLPLVPSAIVAGAYAAENDALDRYREANQRSAEQRRAATERRVLHGKALQIAAALGAPPPPPLTEVAPAPCGARPRIVVRDGAAAAIRLAAAGGSGLLVLDERRVPSLHRVAGFYDEATSTLLNELARGNRVPIVDPNSGRTEMRSLPASVVGVLTTAECAQLHEVVAASYGATAFVPAVPPPIGNAPALVTLLRRIADIGQDGAALTLPARGEALTSAADAWSTLAAGTQPPLSDYLAHLPDLVRRLAAALHLATAAGGDGKPVPEIPSATVKKAIALINTCLLPTAQAVLSPVSTRDAIRDARRIVAHLRTATSAAHPLFERRPLLRSWQESMPASRLDDAIALLEAEHLLTAVQKKGGQQFAVARTVYA